MHPEDLRFSDYSGAATVTAGELPTPGCLDP
jgi:hypothetical protein